MAGQGRITAGVWTPGGDVQFNETDKPLVWQSELDIAIDDIDARLKRPRRRVTDQPAQSSTPAITLEQIDEIAWRVADLLKSEGAAQAPGTAVAAAISKTVASTSPRTAQAPAPPPPEPKRLPHRIAIAIRIPRPFFRLPWPFRRRKRQAMITFSDYRIT